MSEQPRAAADDTDPQDAAVSPGELSHPAPDEAGLLADRIRTGLLRLLERKHT